MIDRWGKKHEDAILLMVQKSGDHQSIWKNIPLFKIIYMVICITGGAGILASTVCVCNMT